MKKFILVLLLLVLVCGCSINQSKKKVMNLLEDDGYVCSENICERDAAAEEFNDGICDPKNTIDFEYKIYTEEVSCSEAYTTIKMKTSYDWGLGITELEVENVAYDSLDTAILYNTGEFSCTNSSESFCDSMKTRMLKHKKDFLNIIDNADIELEDIQ